MCGHFIVAVLAVPTFALASGSLANCEDCREGRPYGCPTEPSVHGHDRQPECLPPWARISLLQRRASLRMFWGAAQLEDDVAGAPESGHERAPEGSLLAGNQQSEESEAHLERRPGPGGGKVRAKGKGDKFSGDSTIGDLQGVNRKDDLLALAHALAVNTGLVLAYMVAFVGLRHSFPQIYMNNVLTGKAALSKARGCCGWVCACCCRSHEEVEETIGLDGAMFIEFSKLCLRILMSIGVPLVFVLWPLNCASVRNRGGICLPFFDQSYLDFGRNVYWFQAGAVWLVVIAVDANIIIAQRNFAERRRDWLHRMPRPWATTVLVENIPTEGRSDTQLRRCFEDRFSPEGIVEAYVVRRTGALPKLVEAADDARQKLAAANAKWKRTGWKPDLRPMHRSLSGQQVDSIFCYGEEAKRASQAAEEGLERFRRSSCSEGAIMSGSGFVTFRRREDAAKAMNCCMRLHDTELLITSPPDPDDVVYQDLMQEPRDRIVVELVGYLCVGLVFFCFTPLTLAIISITRLRTMQKHVPFFAMIVSKYPEIHAFWDAMMGSFILNLVMGFVPTIFAQIFKRCYALKSELWRQQRVQRWYFYFLITFVLLITAIGASLAMVYLELARSPAKVLDLLAASLPGASQFYLKFIMLQWAVEALQLSRHSTLGKYLFRRIWYDKERARELAEPEDQDYDGIGARSARQTLILVIALVFSTVSPLVCPFALIHFCLCRVTYGYLLMFAEGRKRDLGGVFWCTQLKHVQQGLSFYVALMVGILLDRANDKLPGIVAASSFIVVVPSYLYFRKLAWDTLPVEEATTYDMAPARATTSSYVQPELREL